MKESSSKNNLSYAIVATDIVLLRNNNGVIEYATQTVNRPPHYDNMPGLLGGVVHAQEISVDAAHRILQEKTLIKTKIKHLFPLGFYDAVTRDLRGRVVSLAYLGIVDFTTEPQGLVWYELHKNIKLAYDHNKMIEDTRIYLKDHLFISIIMLHFVGEKFIISELKKVFEYIKRGEIDKRNFYKFLEKLPVEMTKSLKKAERGRPANVYKKKAQKNFFLD